ncbi:MAG: phosphatidylglycerol lysyltransferase domain-containing protein, partial [Oscillospiraceae bacterium]
MINFKKITLDDKQWIEEILKSQKYMSCEYSFGNHFIWKDVYNVRIANVNGFYVAALCEEQGISFLFPAGDCKNDALKPVIEQLLLHCKEKNYCFHMHSMLDWQKIELERLFPNKFVIEESRDNFDYIYFRDVLANLDGKDFRKKRTHINKILEKNWRYEKMTKENIPLCKEMYKKWGEDNDIKHDEGKFIEQIAVNQCFDFFEELDFFGGLLFVEENLVAFTISERINSEMVVVHIEKAFADVDGAYPMIKQQIVTSCDQDVVYINREDD